MPRNSRSRQERSPPLGTAGEAEDPPEDEIPLDLESDRRCQQPRLRPEPVSDTREGSWWQRTESRVHRLQQNHLCFSSAIVPCLIVVTVVLILMASRYEHLAEPAEMALNATLEILKLKAIH